MNASPYCVVPEAYDPFWKSAVLPILGASFVASMEMPLLNTRFTGTISTPIVVDVGDTAGFDPTILYVNVVPEYENADWK
jgi:hypothetical protein